MAALTTKGNNVLREVIVLGEKLERVRNSASSTKSGNIFLGGGA